jgi:lysine-specific demethylase/histidyl-hydroxylase NO66
MLTAAMHASAIDFLMNRLPPHPKQLPPKGPAPTINDKIWCRVTGWGYLLPFEMTGMVCEDDDSDGEGEGGWDSGQWG